LRQLATTQNVFDRHRRATRDDLTDATLYWIEHTYNRQRRQRGLGKLTAVEFELAFAAKLESEAT
jgi:transposase InsO family protein